MHYLVGGVIVLGLKLCLITYQHNNDICICILVLNFNIDYQRIFNTHHTFLKRYQLLQDYSH